MPGKNSIIVNFKMCCSFKKTIRFTFRKKKRRKICIQNNESNYKRNKTKETENIIASTNILTIVKELLKKFKEGCQNQSFTTLSCSSIEATEKHFKACIHSGNIVFLNSFSSRELGTFPER